MSEKDLYAKVLKGIFAIPEHVSLEASDLLKKILIIKPRYRMNVDEVKFNYLNLRFFNIIGSIEED